MKYYYYKVGNKRRQVVHLLVKKMLKSRYSSFRKDQSPCSLLSRLNPTLLIYTVKYKMQLLVKLVAGTRDWTLSH